MKIPIKVIPPTERLLRNLKFGELVRETFILRIDAYAFAQQIAALNPESLETRERNGEFEVWYFIHSMQSNTFKDNTMKSSGSVVDPNASTSAKLETPTITPEYGKSNPGESRYVESSGKLATVEDALKDVFSYVVSYSVLGFALNHIDSDFTTLITPADAARIIYAQSSDDSHLLGGLVTFTKTLRSLRDPSAS